MIPKQILDDARIDMQDVADIAAMTGEAYFKGTFRKKDSTGPRGRWPRKTGPGPGGTGRSW